MINRIIVSHGVDRRMNQANLVEEVISGLLTIHIYLGITREPLLAVGVQCMQALKKKHHYI